MIPTNQVLDAVLAALRADWPAVADGDPPDSPPAGTPYAWVEPLSSPSDGAKMGGGEPTALVAVRISSAAVDGDGPSGRTSRRQAQMLSDRLRAVMLTGAWLSGPGWRLAGRWHISTAAVLDPGAWTIHDDYRLLVAKVTAA